VDGVVTEEEEELAVFVVFDEINRFGCKAVGQVFALWTVG
jgi:hypothetical protein